MKALLIAIVLIPYLGICASNSIKTYVGRSFPNKFPLSHCLKHAETLANKMQLINSPHIQVFEYTCTKESFSNKYRVYIKYDSEFMREFINTPIDLDENEKCANHIKPIENNFVKAGHYVIDSYCKKANKVMVTHMPKKSQLLNRIGVSSRFKTDLDCQSFATKLTLKLDQKKYTSIKANCQKVQSVNSTFFFRPSVLYSYSPMNLLQNLTGKQLTDGQCSTLQSNLTSDAEKVFADNKIEIISTYCETNHRGEHFESFLYTYKIMSRVKEYIGLKQETKFLCESKLSALSEQLTSTKKIVLYSFCKGQYTGMITEKLVGHRPHIFYINKPEKKPENKK